MFQFPRYPSARLWIQRAVTRLHRAGFPHSDIPGSKPACGSPRLFAACHVLHRLSAPRHPPCALTSLTSFAVVNVLAPRRAWWRWADSNRRPPACKAGALPLSYIPTNLVGIGGLEPPTSRLSGVRSNHLSYTPKEERLGLSKPNSREACKIDLGFLSRRGGGAP